MAAVGETDGQISEVLGSRDYIRVEGLVEEENLHVRRQPGGYKSRRESLRVQFGCRPRIALGGIGGRARQEPFVSRGEASPWKPGSENVG